MGEQLREINFVCNFHKKKILKIFGKIKFFDKTEEEANKKHSIKKKKEGDKIKNKKC